MAMKVCNRRKRDRNGGGEREREREREGSMRNTECTKRCCVVRQICNNVIRNILYNITVVINSVVGLTVHSPVGKLV